ncbi:MAG: hypothetical protein Q9202_002372 [Teloschistes flavicans]
MRRTSEEVSRRLEHARIPGVLIITPNVPSTPLNAPRNVSHLQQVKPSELLQVPSMNATRKLPSTPGPINSSGKSNWDHSSVAGNSSKRVPNKNKRVTSAKKAQEVSDEVALDIAKKIDFTCGEPKAIQAAIQRCVFLALNQGHSRKRPAPPTSSEDDVSRCKRRLITCDQCEVTTARRCDMKKHQKRHTRPYGCTFPGCYKKLGSKNDWKRHENTQHYQMETWRCQEVDEKSHIGQCASIFYRREQFQGHLREKHQINDDKHVREQSKCCRIGRNGQKGFWCGFCKQIVKLDKKGLAAWEERFDHIDDMHYKKGQSMDDWVQLDSDLTNGAMGRGDYLANDSEDDNGGDDESIGDLEDDQRSQTSARSHTSANAQQNIVESRVASADADADADANASTASTRQATRCRRSKIWTSLVTSGRPIVVWSAATNNALVAELVGARKPLGPCIPYEQVFRVHLAIRFVTVCSPCSRKIVLWTQINSMQTQAAGLDQERRINPKAPL